MYLKRNKELEIISLYRGNYAKRFYLREIAKLSKLPLKTTQNTLFKLESEKILKSKTEGKNKYFYLNLENIQTKSFILQAEIHKTSEFLEKYSAFKTFLKSVKTNDLLIVFGSFSKFKAERNSDIDLMVVSNKKTSLPFHLLPYKNHEIYLAEKSFVKAVKEKETLIKEIEENHVILNNHSFYINTLWENYGK